MTYFPEIAIKSADSPSIDAFGRWRVSDNYTIFDSKLINGSASLDWDFSGSDGGFSEYSQSEAAFYLKTTTTQNSRAIRQTKRSFNYQPAKSQLVFLTGVVNPETGFEKNIGYFNDNNGLFFQASGSSMYVVKRNNGVDTKVAQTAWNLDKVNGTGQSKITMDYSKAQIYVIDFEWLGVGRVRFGHAFGGDVVYTHEFHHENELDSVYMATPNLPLRYEIKKLDVAATTAELKEICASVVSEGGLNPNGRPIAIDNNQTAVTISQNTTGSLVAIRLKENTDTTINLKSLAMISPTTSNQTYWAVYFNPSGSGAFTWEDIPNSSIQKATNVGSVLVKPTNKSATLQSGYGIVGTSPASTFDYDSQLNSELKLGRKINGERDVIVLAASPTATSATYKGSLIVQEI